MHNLQFKMQYGQCTIENEKYIMHNVCKGEDEPPSHTSKHALHLLPVCVLPVVLFSILPIFPNLNMCVSPELQLCLCILQLQFTFSDLYFLEFYLCLFVLSFMQSQQVTHQSFRRFLLSYRVYPCLEFYAGKIQP